MGHHYEDYSLYISKSSELRSRIKQVIHDIVVPNLDTDEYDEKKLKQLIETVASSKVYKEKPRQTTYAIIDHLLLNYLNTKYFDTLIEFLMENFRNYIVIHEVAALSWGDKKIDPQLVFDLIEQSKLSEKHQYHILNEMSVSHPEETLKMIIRGIETGRYEVAMKEKIMLKMLQDRQRTKPLAKQVEPVMSTDEIRELENNITH